ncbi:hypothetical protein N7453_006774 [Penicillium expansum]|nr:hypothetical protein N7453_006774 [Penicillium expansum]
MAVPRSWFPSGLDEGDTVTLNKPKTSKWIIDKKVNTHSYQREDRSVDSYASVLFTCHNATDGKEAFMRIYTQVPHAGFENADKATRAREATEFTPRAKGIQISHSGPVPRGHITWIVWEKVPGKRLGDFKSAFLYWDMDRNQRKRVREVFLREFPMAKRMGYFPEGAKPRNLVWDENNEDLYFVGFRDAMPFDAKGNFGEEWFPRFDLAKPPQRHYRMNRDYKGDISDWKL